MSTTDFSFQWTGLRKLPSSSSSLNHPLSKTLTPFSKPRNSRNLTIIQSISLIPNIPSSHQNPLQRRTTKAFAGRSKKKPGGPSPGRIEGNAEVRREAKKRARIKSRRLAENLFYRHKNPSRNHADDFTEEELQMIGLGYDRMVRFMEKDDPNLRHPYDWYKYGQYGPYNWRGIVIGDPIRGRFSDERVSMISSVRDHEEWEEIERVEMAGDFSRRLSSMDKTLGFKYFWVFVRHPKWRITELPWQQWTLVCEVVLETGEKRLDKWNLMGRLGNKARALITQCAAWMRPDIIYVKRPVYQCRFEPQDDFFKVLGPLIDPETENQYQFELKLENGRVEMCTYFGGLCKIVRINPKAYVDDVAKAYEKLSDEKKSMCLEFLLTNHPVELLHPYTMEWKAKLEEMELGCDSLDDDDDDDKVHEWSDNQITDWIEEDDGDRDGDDDEEDAVVDVEETDGDDELGIEEEEEESGSGKESEKYWEEEFKKAVRSSEGMENLVKKSVEVSTEFYKKQLKVMDEQKRSGSRSEEERDDGNVKGKKSGGDQTREGWWEEENNMGNWRWGRKRRIKRSKIPPELFLRAAVRPFTYRNLVKEIVLLRHAIIDGEISGKY